MNGTKLPVNVEQWFGSGGKERENRAKGMSEESPVYCC